jgi:two-component system, OmpR family, phosphate regulon sensor histidine kinase PhoR
MGKSLNILVILGSFIICGLLIFQSVWLIDTWNLRNEAFDNQVIKALRQVAQKISEVNKTELPKSNLIQKNDSHYAVNVNSPLDANILEDFLIREFDEASLNTIFEYAIYDCTNDSLKYVNYCNLSTGPENFDRSENLPRFNDLIYYFVVNFPQRESYVINDLKWNVLFSIFTIFAVLTFLYSMWVIMRQKKVTDLQTDFINNMTHEFKTPISSIKIASSVLLENSNIKDDKRLSQYASIIRDQNERLNMQVEKVLNIARLEKDKFKLNIDNIELNEFVNDIVVSERIKFESENGELIFESKCENAYIKADKLHLTNVLSNILDNALKYCEKNPTVKVKLTNKKQNYQISVTDNGIGIEKDNYKKIFDKFYRVSTGNVHNVKGFGLGLYYVLNICEAHQWKMDIDSTIDQGTTFKIEIPKSKEI